jgi:hypothetical protein
MLGFIAGLSSRVGCSSPSFFPFLPQEEKSLFFLFFSSGCSPPSFFFPSFRHLGGIELAVCVWAGAIEKM